MNIIKRSEIPDFHFKRIGPDTIEIIQKGYPTRTYTKAEALREAAYTADSDRRYILHRAADTLEGKSPRDYRGERPVDRWGDPRLGREPKSKKTRSLLRRVWESILGL
jgi:hypothetical protein